MQVKVEMGHGLHSECSENKDMTTYKAEAHFKIPRKSLDDKIKSHVQHESRPGPSTVLSAKEEDTLVSYLLYMAECDSPQPW